MIVVFPEPLGPTSVVIPGGIDSEMRFTPENFAVELRHVLENDPVVHPRTTSRALMRLFSMAAQTKQASESITAMASVRHRKSIVEWRRCSKQPLPEIRHHDRND